MPVGAASGAVPRDSKADRNRQNQSIRTQSSQNCLAPLQVSCQQFHDDSKGQPHFPEMLKRTVRPPSLLKILIEENLEGSLYLQAHSESAGSLASILAPF